MSDSLNIFNFAFVNGSVLTKEYEQRLTTVLRCRKFGDPTDSCGTKIRSPEIGVEQTDCELIGLLDPCVGAGTGAPSWNKEGADVGVVYRLELHPGAVLDPRPPADGELVVTGCAATLPHDRPYRLRCRVAPSKLTSIDCARDLLLKFLHFLKYHFTQYSRQTEINSH
ncbi:hypothetical protein J6590_033738 [Homalodisca vitripennis]|nr:hypothetical protein J6590_033738 [Homalodisca vitripennis]